MKRILIDTNALSRFFMGDDTVLNYLSEADKILISILVLGELLSGYKGGNKEKQNRESLENFIIENDVEIVNATKSTAEIFAEIKSKLRKSGNPIPINDVWIAAHAIEFNATFITFDKHFTLIEGLHIWSN